jgi:voltage-gated potassium channel Kch
MLALVFALVTDAVVGARITRALGQYPVPRRDHVIVCGAGRTGGLIVQALVDAGVTCVIVDRDEEGLDMALVRRHRIPVVLGDLASDETLAALRLESARALIVMTGDEVANLQCALLHASGCWTCAWCCASPTTTWRHAWSARRGSTCREASRLLPRRRSRPQSWAGGPPHSDRDRSGSGRARAPRGAVGTHAASWMRECAGYPRPGELPARPVRGLRAHAPRDRRAVR